MNSASLSSYRSAAELPDRDDEDTTPQRATLPAPNVTPILNDWIDNQRCYRGTELRVLLFLARLAYDPRLQPAEADLAEIASMTGASEEDTADALEELLLRGLVQARTTLPGDGAVYWLAVGE